MVDEQKLELIGGNVALDFVNTMERLTEAEHGYADFLRLATETGLLSEKRQRALLKQRDHGQQAKLVKRLVEIRDCMHGLFASAAEGKLLPEPAVAVLNGYVAEAAVKRRLRREKPGAAVWVWENDEADALAPLWPMVWSAAELLAAPERPTLRRCAYDTCGYFFLDTSKNQSRRWCDMKVCGNRAKARSHYQKTRAALEEQS